MLVSEQAPEFKRAGIAAAGAKVEVAGATYDEAEAEAKRRAAADPNAVFVSAFDDDHVIAGNGGLMAREILAQLPDVQCIVVPVGGGGLAGGIGVEVVPRGIKVLGASPESNCAMRRSLEDGRAYTTYDGGPTLAEGLEGAVSERTYAMARDYFPEIALVSELQIREAIVYAYRTLGIICEASAAPAIAALLDDASVDPRPPNRRRRQRREHRARPAGSASVGHRGFIASWLRRRRRLWRGPGRPFAARAR